MQYNADETIDELLNGTVRIIQRRDGYRVNEDSIHLCRFVKPMPEATGIDLGAGCGVVAIVLVLEEKVKMMVALELQKSLADLARKNASLNGLGNRIEVIQGDILKVEELFEPHSFDLAVSNPPYREIGRGRLSPSAEKTIARHEQTCSLEDLVRAAAYLLAQNGIFAFCHRLERWGEIEKTLDQHGFIINRRENTGELVMVEAMRNRVSSKQ